MADHPRYLDDEVPLALLEKGENRFTLTVLQGKLVVLERLELAVYRKGMGRSRTAPSKASEETKPQPRWSGGA